MTFRELEDQKYKEIEAIKNKYNAIITELQNNCSHVLENGESALEEFCDDDDCNGWRQPTYDKWKECKICRKIFE